MTVARLGNIMLQVADVGKAFAFYTSVFDFVEMLGMSNRPAFAAVTAGGVTISMRAGREGAAPSSLIELGFAVADPEYVASKLIGSIVRLLGLALAVPDHSTLSRRAETLQVVRPPSSSVPVHLIVDSTGLRLSGPGEWLVEKHGGRTRRSWRKLHLGVDAPAKSSPPN